MSDSGCLEPLVLIRTVFDTFYVTSGNISKGDVLTTLPFGNTVDVITIKGKYIRQAFEHSVAHYDLVDSSGAFLQVSGK